LDYGFLALPRVRKAMVSDVTPHPDHRVPQPQRLEHSDASCDHDNDIENSLDDAGHRNVSVDEPQTDSDDYDGENDIENRLDSAGDWDDTVYEPQNHSHED